MRRIRYICQWYRVLVHTFHRAFVNIHEYHILSSTQTFHWITQLVWNLTQFKMTRRDPHNFWRSWWCNCFIQDVYLIKKWRFEYNFYLSVDCDLYADILLLIADTWWCAFRIKCSDIFRRLPSLLQKIYPAIYIQWQRSLLYGIRRHPCIQQVSRSVKVNPSIPFRNVSSCDFGVHDWPLLNGDGFLPSKSKKSKTVNTSSSTAQP